jgi:hypothetical protein
MTRISQTDPSYPSIFLIMYNLSPGSSCSSSAIPYRVWRWFEFYLGLVDIEIDAMVPWPAMLLAMAPASTVTLVCFMGAVCQDGCVSA